MGRYGGVWGPDQNLVLDPAGGEVDRRPQLVLLITASPSDPQEKTLFSSGGGLPGGHLTLFSSRLRNPLINMRRVSRTGEKCSWKDNGRAQTEGRQTHTLARRWALPSAMSSVPGLLWSWRTPYLEEWAEPQVGDDRRKVVRTKLETRPQLYGHFLLKIKPIEHYVIFSCYENKYEINHFVKSVN